MMIEAKFFLRQNMVVLNIHHNEALLVVNAVLKDNLFTIILIDFHSEIPTAFPVSMSFFFLPVTSDERRPSINMNHVPELVFASSEEAVH